MVMKQFFCSRAPIPKDNYVTLDEHFSILDSPEKTGDYSLHASQNEQKYHLTPENIAYERKL